MLLVRKRGEGTWRAPKVTSYADEPAFRRLLRQSPELLPWPETGPMAVVDEFTIPSDYAADLVGVDVNGNIMIVECKLASNPESHAAVVGQILGYAAWLEGMSYEQFDSRFRSRSGCSLEEHLTTKAPEGWDVESFRTWVAENLAAGRFRLVIAVDALPDELAKTLRFLYRYTTNDLDMNVLELPYYADDDFEIVLPQVYDRAALQEEPKGRLRWDEASFFMELEKLGASRESVDAARDLFNRLKAKGLKERWGSGRSASVNFDLHFQGKKANVLGMFAWPGSKGQLTVQFRFMRQQDIPLDVLRRMALQLEDVSDSKFQADLRNVVGTGFDGEPSMKIDPHLTEPGVIDAILRAVDELIAWRTGTWQSGEVEDGSDEPACTKNGGGLIEETAVHHPED